MVIQGVAVTGNREKTTIKINVSTSVLWKTQTKGGTNYS